MWNKTIAAIIMAAALTGTAMKAQNLNPIFEFMGTDSPEDMDPYDVERLEELMEHPLRLNHASESKLEESGLLSRYQIASLTDYRTRHGDILSFNELSAVDGFGPDFVAGLRPFVSLESNRLPGAVPSRRIRNDISVRSSLRTKTDPSYGLKYKLTAGDRITGGISISRTSSAGSMAPDTYSGHFAYHFKSRPGKFIIGDFNARFGQGLALWNGMSFSGLTSSSSFMKKPSGISASSSFTGGYSLRGVATDVCFGRMRITALTSFMESGESFGVMPALNGSWLFKAGRLSLTHYADFAISAAATRIPDMKTSADAAFCINGLDLFAETSLDWVSMSLAALAGMTVPAGDDVRLAAMLRYYPSSFTSARSAAARSTTKCSNEYAASFAADFNLGGWVDMNGASGFGSSARRLVGRLSADLAYFPVPKEEDATVKSIQIKAQTEWTWMISGSFKASARISERIRTWGEPFRTDVRTDFSYMSEHFLATLRINALQCADIGLLGYLEGGYKAVNLSIYLRTGLFRIDNWDDRIYAYERDAPGSFNVPAYYGRGLWAALTMSWKFARWGRMYMRSAMTSYPFMEEKKPGRAELKLQMVLDL